MSQYDVGRDRNPQSPQQQHYEGYGDGQRPAPSWSSPRTPLSSREQRAGVSGGYSSPILSAAGGPTPRTYSTPGFSYASPQGHTSLSSVPAPSSSTAPINSPRQEQPGPGYRQASSYSQSPAAASTSMHSPHSPISSPTAPNQEAVEHAARVMDRLMNRDLQFPALYKSLLQVADPGLAQAGSRPISGFMDYDYPPFVQQRVVPESQFTMTHHTPIPTELSEMLNQADVQYCRMGLFAEIYRAWMTIDSDIYLWDFRDGTDLSFYDGLKEPIITMSVVPAKPSVFQNSIRHLLCVSTASEIVILGFVVSEIANSPVIELVPQPVFVLSTESLTFGIIYGTKLGRIFLGAKDGSIHEVNYQAEKGWMSDRCWKTNLTHSYLKNILKFISTSSSADPIVEIVSDDVRNILYVRTQGGSLEVFDLGRDGFGFTRVAYMSFEGLVNDVVNLSKKTLESNVVKKILTISPVSTGEINLIAVLDTGTRLYFTCYEPPSNTNFPSTIKLVHARMPPGYCTSNPLPKPSVSHVAFASTGVFALAARSAQETDSFWLICPFMFPCDSLSEVYTIQRLPGETLAIKTISSLTGTDSTGLEALPDIIIQHLDWQREVVVLTSNGVCVFQAHKPYEMLKSLLIQCGNTDSFRNHFECVSKEQPLANAALLCVHPTTRGEPSVLEMAIKAFFLHGGDELRNLQQGRVYSPFDNTMEFNPNLVSTPRQEGTTRVSHTSFGVGDAGFASPSLHHQGPQQPTYSPPDQPLGDCVFSSRHDALYLTVGRILFHFWNRQLVNVVSGGRTGPPIVTPNITGKEVTHAITFLQNIATFVCNNPSLYLTRINITSTLFNPNTPEGRAAYNHELEKQSILALRDFLSLSLEVLNMWKILCDHQFHIVLHGVDNQLQNVTMRDLVVTGHTTVSVIINALISKYLGDNAAVDAITMRLREVCPTLFKSEDAIGSKVAEILSKVRNSTDHQERDLLLKESLVLAEKICGHGRVNIGNLCKQYSDLGFPVGTVRLCVSAAKASDPEKLALDTVKVTSSSGDTAGITAFQRRADIYRITFDMLDAFVQLAATTRSPLLRSSEDRMAPQTAQLCAEETIHAILSSDDEMFHISLYNWLLERKMFDRLLEIKHPYLDSFLQRAADAVVSGQWPGGGMSSNDTRVLDLLWRHHEMNQNHSAAAHILSKLAESTTTGLNLQQRLEYLSRAIICSKSNFRGGDALEILEDKVEVAQIQKNILDSINARIANIISQGAEDENSADVKILQDASAKLNSQLLSITILYGEFAHPLKLNDAKLEIFYAAAHGDRPTIEAIWSDIIEDELSNNTVRSLEQQMEVIRRKIVSLGRKYRTSPTFFPIDFLTEHLETMRPRDTENVGWVFRSMLEVGISFSDVLGVYERLWRKNLAKSGGNDMENAKVILFMIDSITANEHDSNATFMNRPDLLERCKDLISNMIVEVSSRFDNPAPEMSVLLNRVRDRLDKVVIIM